MGGGGYVIHTWCFPRGRSLRKAVSFQEQVSNVQMKVIVFIIIQIFSRFKNNLQKVLTITCERKYLVDYNLGILLQRRRH